MAAYLFPGIASAGYPFIDAQMFDYMAPAMVLQASCMSVHH